MSKIKVIANSDKSFKIYLNEQLIVNCDSNCNINDVVCGLGLNKFPVEIFSNDIITHHDQDLDSVINDINDTYIIDKPVDNKPVDNEPVDNKPVDNKPVDNKPVDNNKPVGNINVPNSGDLIYIETTRGILKKMFGGIATVDYTTTQPCGINEYVEDEDEEVINETTGDVLFVALVELPGVFLNWSELKTQQQALSVKYGYKPAQLV